MTSVVAVFALAVAGLPLAWALTRSVPLAVVLSPLAAAAVSSVAVVLMLWLRGPLLPWFGAVFLATVALAWFARGAAAVPGGSWREAGLLGVPLLAPFLMMFQSPLGWDAHAIWWQHAGYFAQGGDFARAAIGNETIAITHTDYPPIASAPVAVAWRLLDSLTFRPALAVNVAITWSAVVLVAYAVRRATANAPAWLSVPAALAAACAAWLPQFTAPAEGYSDTMCAAAFVAGAVLLLGAADPVRVTPLALFLVSAAVLTKNEGLPLAGVVAVVATLRLRHEPRRAAWCWLPVGVAAVWSATARVFGAKNDLMADGRFGQLLHGDHAAWSRLPEIQAALSGQVGSVVGAAVLAAVLGTFFLRGRRRALGLAGDGWLWVVFGGYWAAITFIYLISPYPIGWHLSTSVDRVTIVMAMLAGVSAATWLVVSLAPAPASAAIPAQPDPPAPEGERGDRGDRRAAGAGAA
ncbi:hypothetical protein ACQP1P_11945 [Dactylosporangium sp. CA-052675]|uniref:hypothetical protein n=1 Tax=Dactylosporangium sp. CA-052675 TaxID=3239927 RepID=UPI003D8CC6E6